MQTKTNLRSMLLPCNKKKLKVKVDMSPHNIEGTKGLFAFNGTDNDEIVFPAGAEIGDYTGEMLSGQQFKYRYPDEVMATYFHLTCIITNLSDHYIDASKDRCLID